MKKKKIFIYAVLPVVGLLLLGAGFVSAHGFGWFGSFSPEQKQAMFQRKADMLGVSVEELEQKWEDKANLTKEEWQAKKAARMQELIDEGVITQEQADARAEFIKSKADHTKDSEGFHKGFYRGFHKSWRLK